MIRQTSIIRLDVMHSSINQECTSSLKQQAKAMTEEFVFYTMLPIILPKLIEKFSIIKKAVFEICPKLEKDTKFFKCGE